MMAFGCIQSALSWLTKMRLLKLTNHYSVADTGCWRMRSRRMVRAIVLAPLLTIAFAGASRTAVAQSDTDAPPKTAPAAPAAPAANVSDSSPLTIDTVSLPGTYPKAVYAVHLHARGGAPPFQWKLESGDLPPGLKLEDDGTLHGSPERAGEFKFTISARDGSRPQQDVQRDYVLKILSAISMEWKNPARVSGSRIDGSVTVTNTTDDDLDFTFVVEAVAEDGRATAIGYQRFPLKKGAIDFEIPFGETLAHGAYVVHVDGVGEIAAKNEIHRARLQTPGALQVVAGP
jgi:hypothetical protein